MVVVRMRARIGLGACLVGLGLFAAGCGKAHRSQASDSPSGGTAGATGIAGTAGKGSTGGTTGSGGAPGEAGQGGDPGSASGAAGSVATAGSGGLPARPPKRLGQACDNDSDCWSTEADFICIPSNSMAYAGGGPPGGVCTLQCDSNDACSAVSPGAFCLNFEAENYCVEGCTIGIQPLPDPPDQPVPDKCHGRADFACTPLEAIITGPACTDYRDCNPDETCYNGQCAGLLAGCLPVCTKDANCPTGTFCDRAYGFCVATPTNTGLPLGSECDPEAATDPCAGFCLGTNEVPNLSGMCSENCKFLTQCGFNDTEASGACVFTSYLNERPGWGDQAFCTQFCDCTSDCLTPGFGCVPTILQIAEGHAGLCGYPFTIDGDPVETLECP